MKIVLTGGSGSVGQAIVTEALLHGHSLINMDRVPPSRPQPGVSFVEAQVDDYDALVRTFAGADAVIHMAAIPTPGRHSDQVVHNNNVVGSYNALRAAAENGIKRVCQASSVNAIGHAYSRHPRYDYFPLDEGHPTYNEDPYSLSKWICELQADSFVRRYEDMVIASMRFHWVVPKAQAALSFNKPGAHRNLWAYTLPSAAARACLLSLNAPFSGHEAFFIVAPETTSHRSSLELAREFYPSVPVTGDLRGHNAFFSSYKAERLLGWTHYEGAP